MLGTTLKSSAERESRIPLILGWPVSRLPSAQMWARTVYERRGSYQGSRDHGSFASLLTKGGLNLGIQSSGGAG
jgi:hypothetical protein